MLQKIIKLSIDNKLIILLITATIVGFGLFSLTQIPIGAVPDITNNQVQVITTSQNLSTQDVEQFITYPIELEMANLPGVVEIRSISKFGLSVVTIVFEDKIAIIAATPKPLSAPKVVPFARIQSPSWYISIPCWSKSKTVLAFFWCTISRWLCKITV